MIVTRRCVYVPDDYRQPAEILAAEMDPSGLFLSPVVPGLLIPLHRDDITPRSTRAGRNRGR